MPRYKAGLVGVTGYTGMELARLMPGHSEMELVKVTSRAESGKKLKDIYPFMASYELGELVITTPDPDDLAKECDLVFLAVPHCAAQEIAAALLEKGLKVVDLSADFRIREASVYEEWYQVDHKHPVLLQKAVYGLPELYRDQIEKADLVANPGCYPTSAILGMAPALTAGIVELGGIVVDSKSGATGAGRKASQATLFCEVHDSFKAYNLGKHRHTPEIEQEYSALSGEEMTISFNPHLVPMNRGILTTIYTQLKTDDSLDEVVALYEKFYADKPWVRVLPKGELPQTRWVRGTMFCDIGLTVDKRTGRLIVVSAIDNLCRGASGQALANANLMLGVEMRTGLKGCPLMP